MDTQKKTGREIKFRAWDKERGEMIFNEFTVHPSGFITSFGDDVDFPLMQFTGLKDCYGKEIYEGDVCSVNQGEDKFEVVWKGIGFWFKQVSEGELFVFTPPDFWIEVIGNIYENKKLVKFNK